MNGRKLNPISRVPSQSAVDKSPIWDRAQYSKLANNRQVSCPPCPPTVIIEKDPDHAEIPRGLDPLLIAGDATDEDLLEQACIHRARGLITAIHSDPENVFVTLTARQLNPHLQIIARASEKGTESKLLRAGADRVISPFEIAGKRMAYTALRPGVVNFFDVVLRTEGVDMHLEEVDITPTSQLVGKNLREADLGRETGAIIIGIHNSAGEASTRSASNFSLAGITLRAGDKLIALGSDEQVRRLKGFVAG